MNALITVPAHTAPAAASSSAKSTRHYLFLDGLRGATAFYVMVYHLLAWVPSELPNWVTRLQRPLSFGHVAVSIFIVLSGYSLGLPVARTTDRRMPGGTGKYLVRRARRILPPYLAATLIGLAVVATVGRFVSPTSVSLDLSLASVATHLLLIQNLWRAYAYTINMAHWSVAAEWQIYFVFPYFLLPAWRLGGEVGLILAGFVISAIPLLLLPAGHNLSWTCPWYVSLFTIGAVAATFERAPVSRLLGWAMLAVIAFLAVVYCEIHHAFYTRLIERPAVEFAKDFVAGMVVAVMLVYCVASCNGSFPRSMFVRLLESYPLRWLGARSYSLYLLHCSVLTLCIAAANRTGLSDMHSFELRAVVGVPLSVILASAAYAAFERPFLQSKGKAA